MADVMFVPQQNWDSLPIQPPAGRWLIRMRPLILGFLVCIGIGAVLGIVDAVLHYAFPVWIPLVPLVVGIAVGVSILPLVVLAMRPYYAERKLGYTTWPDPKPMAAYRDSQR